MSYRFVLLFLQILHCMIGELANEVEEDEMDYQESSSIGLCMLQSNLTLANLKNITEEEGVKDATEEGVNDATDANGRWLPEADAEIVRWATEVEEDDMECQESSSSGVLTEEESDEEEGNQSRRYADKEDENEGLRGAAETDVEEDEEDVNVTYFDEPDAAETDVEEEETEGRRLSSSDEDVKNLEGRRLKTKNKWAWWQRTPGCVCDVVSRRRGERCRMKRNDEHYYAKQCALGYRRRSSIQGCWCEHESTLGKGWYCPAVWWYGGRHNCRCYKHYVKIGSKCIKRCSMKVSKVVGGWTHVQKVVGTSSITVSYGTTTTRTRSSTSHWSRSMSLAMSSETGVGFEVLGFSIGTSFSASQASGREWGKLYTTEVSTTKSSSTTHQWSTEGIPQGKHVWQWKLDFYDKCGTKKSTTLTRGRIVTESGAEEPCCLPNMDVHNEYGVCECDKTIHDDRRRPRHCKPKKTKCRRQPCNDSNPRCKLYLSYCKHPQLRSFMEKHCKHTCGVCR